MKTMIITGASSGIGHALALRAAQASFATVLVARNVSALDDLANAIHAGGGLCTTLALDIRDAQAASAIVSTTVQRYGRIDIVVNNAGIAAGGTLAQQTDEDLRAQWETHVLGALRLTREALRELEKSRGQIFFFGSGVARVPTPGLGAYPLAKAAVRAMATQMRRELRPSGIAVTYVDPGAVDTPFMQRAGMAGPPTRLRVSPHAVAKKILHAVTTRPTTVNAVPWQTALVTIGELLPTITDAVLAAAPQIVGTQPTSPILDTTLRQAQGDTVVSPTPQEETPISPQPLEPCHAEPVEASAPLSPPAQTTAMQPADPQCHAEPVPLCHAERVEASAPPTLPPPTEPFDAALEPVTRRMERIKLPRDFIAQLLVPGTQLELGEVAMRWAGMPNKNERAAVAEVFDALTASQYLQKTGDETWTVLRSSNDS